MSDLHDAAAARAAAMNDRSQPPIGRTDIPNGAVEKRGALADFAYVAATQVPSAVVGAVIGVVGSKIVGDNPTPPPPPTTGKHQTD